MNKIFANLLRVCFFTGPSAIGVKSTTTFVSTLASRPQEKEIPIPMLALIGAAVTIVSLNLFGTCSDCLIPGPRLAHGVEEWLAQAPVLLC